MGERFLVAVHYGNENGYIDYDPAAGSATVVLGDAGKRSEIEAYLSNPQTITAPDKTLLDFAPSTFTPVQDLEHLKLALTRLWEHTGVLVDWSRPIPKA